MKKLLGTLVLFMMAGCASYTPMQTCRFVDDDGRFLTVSYESGMKDHINEFVSPGNGKTFEFRSKLRVKVDSDFGVDFTAYQAMNFYGSGTLYKTDNNKWQYLANGFTCHVLKLQADESTGESGYVSVYQGVICQDPVGSN